MKTFRIFTAVLSITLAFSCQKETLSDNHVARETESATLETGVLTKTSLSGKEVHWTSDDVIAVFDDSNYKNTFTITEASGSYANFAGSVTTGTTQIYAVYPENLALSASGSTLKVNIPTNQTSKAGSFAEEHNISVAKASKTPGVVTIGDVTFNNVCSYLKFTVPSSVKDVKTVKFETSKAITGEATVDASSDAPIAVVSDKGSKSVTMSGTYSAGSEFLFVLAPGTINGFTVTVTTANATWSVTKDVKVTLEAGKYKNLGVLDFELGASASATHTKSDKTLTGTDVTVNLNLDASALSYITSLNLQVADANGNVVRSLEKTNASSTETLSANSDWPYLPQGTYTVSGSYSLGGNKVRTIAPVTFESPAPTFEVTSNAYTSYTKYKNGDSNGANSCVAENIYNVTNASVTISDAILNNANYSSLKGGYTYKLDGTATTTATATGMSWGEHKVTASYKFDSVTAEGTAVCHITGLPYKMNPKSNDSSYAWGEEGYVNWNTDGGVRLGKNQWGGDAYILKTFNIPSNTNIVVYADGIVNGTGSIIKVENTISITVSGKEIFSKTQKGKSEANFKCDNKTGTLSGGNGSIKINSSYNLESAKVVIKNFTVNYGSK